VSPKILRLKQQSCPTRLKYPSSTTLVSRWGKHKLACKNSITALAIQIQHYYDQRDSGSDSDSGYVKHWIHLRYPNIPTPHRRTRRAHPVSNNMQASLSLPGWADEREFSLFYTDSSHLLIPDYWCYSQIYVYSGWFILHCISLVRVLSTLPFGLGFHAEANFSAVDMSRTIWQQVKIYTSGHVWTP